MKHMGLIAIWLCTALLLVSCTPRTTDTEVEDTDTWTGVAMGRYVEEEWICPDGEGSIQSTVKDAQGGILVISKTEASDIQNCYSTTDGREWKKESPGWLEEANRRGLTGFTVCINKSGNVLAGYWDTGRQETVIAMYGESTGFQEVDLDISAVEMALDITVYAVDTLRMGLGDDDSIYVNVNSMPVRFAPDGSFVRAYSDTYVNTWDVTGDWLVISAYQADGGGAPEDSVVLFDLKADTDAQYIPCELFTTRGDVLAVTGDGSIFLANAKGIFHRTLGGSVWEKVVEGSLTSLGAFTAYTMTVHSDNQFLVGFTQGKDCNYRFDTSVTTVPSTELTVYTISDRNATLDWAIYEFRNAQPDTVVRRTNLLEEGISIDEALDILGTELLAGKGPDLLFMEYTAPLASYMEKGVLCDLSDIAQPLLDSGAVFPNIVRSYQRDGTIYALPARFSYDTVWGQREAVAASYSLTGLGDYAEANPDKELFETRDPTYLMELFYDSCSPAWVQPDGEIDEGAIAAFLRDVKRIAGESPQPGDPGLNNQNEAMLLAANGRQELCRATLKGFRDITRANGVVTAINGIRVLPDGGADQVTSVEDSIIRDYFTLMPGQAQGVFTPRSIIGVNAASGQQELAKEFVRHTVSPEVQRRDTNEGFPILREAVQYNIENQKKILGSTMGDDMILVYGCPSRGVFDAVVEQFDSLEIPLEWDSDLRQFVEEQLVAVVAGDTAIEEASTAIAARIKVRVAEGAR